MFAKVIVDINIPSLDRLFDYVIKEDQLDNLKIGMRVVVPFGAQTRLGYVIDIVEESNNATREIIEVLDIKPSIDEELFKYVEFLKSKNQTSLLNILETILPKEIFLRYYEEITVLNSNNISKELLEHLSIDRPVKYTRTLQVYNKEINNLITNKDIKVKKIYEQKAKEKLVSVVTYVDDKHYSNAVKYKELIDFIKSNGNYTRAQLIKQGYNASAISTLIRNNVFESKEAVQSRDISFKNTSSIPLHQLNDEQQNAYQEIGKYLGSSQLILLKGVTGSGKTEVYMKLMKDVLKENKTILYLVPEISLVAPLVQYLKSRFDENIVHYNSSLSSGERFDSYTNIINGNAKIVVGTRSSIFLPIQDLGLIVVDEEQDSSYNQSDSKVSYNLIDIIKIKSKYHNIPVILGSATPKISTMYNALNGEYLLVELTKRATNQPLPKVSFVDMKQELINGNKSIFSKLLYDSIQDRLNKGQQVILLYNRRGYSSFTMCRTCSYTPKCKNCDISLTYYKKANELRCSYCNYKEPNLTTCPSCYSNSIRPIGIGIDQVVETVTKTFDKAKVIKIDSDSTTRKGSHEKIWLDFKENKYNILVGTKMISKGLDFENVTLVGILMADLELRSPTYLATEETYSLLTQMSGRSGRHIKGESIIQGYDLENYSIKAVKTNYEDFYKEAIYQRRLTKYEPFYDVSQILVKNESYLKCYQDANRITKELQKHFEIVLGPVEPVIKYIRNEYRFVITIKDKAITEKIIFETIEKLNETSIVNYINNPTII